MTFRFTTEEQKPTTWPKRVQILIDDYLAAGKAVDKSLRMDYQIETIDNHERIFEDRVREKPDSLKTTVNAIYRIKTRNNEEFYYYAATKECKNKLDQPIERFSYERYGYHRSPIVTMEWNETRERNEPRVTSYKQGYELKWDKAEVKKLLESSYFPCEYFYVGLAGTSANDPIQDKHYLIQNMTDFLEGSFEDLMDLGRFGLSGPEPSLYLLEAARSEAKEKRKDDARRKIRDQTGTDASAT